MHFKWAHLLIIIGCFLQGCRKDNIDKTQYEQFSAYIPFNTGSYLAYQVDSVVYDDFKDTVFATTSYRLEVIDSIDNSIKTRKLFRTMVYERKDSTEPWTFIQADQWALTNKYFEKQIDNERQTLLSFPSNLESIWDVNLYNTQGPIMRYYTSINDTFFDGKTVTQNVLKVENEPKSNTVVNKQTTEVYAKNIGCISKKTINIETQFGKKRGFSVLYTLYDYEI